MTDKLHVTFSHQSIPPIYSNVNVYMCIVYYLLIDWRSVLNAWTEHELVRVGEVGDFSTAMFFLLAGVVAQLKCALFRIIVY